MMGLLEVGGSEDVGVMGVMVAWMLWDDECDGARMLRDARYAGCRGDER